MTKKELLSSIQEQRNLWVEALKAEQWKDNKSKDLINMFIESYDIIRRVGRFKGIK
jgi:uncharacterized protein YdaT